MLQMLTEYTAHFLLDGKAIYIALLLTTLLSYLVWFFRRDSVIAAVNFLTVITISLWWAGYPSPLCPSGEVISGKIVADEAIYLYLNLEGQNTPHSCALPYSNGAAQRFQSGMGDLEAGEGGTMNYYFDFNFGLYPEEGHQFRVTPPLSLPDKPNQGPAQPPVREFSL